MTTNDTKSSQRSLADLASRTAVARFFAHHGLPYLKHGGEWRIPGDDVPTYGMVQGLPRSQGRLAITDGILAYIVRDDSSLFVGHLEWWQGLEHDAATPGTSPRMAGTATKASKRAQRIRREYQ